MRTIKFRGKSLNTRMWVYGDLSHKGKRLFVEYEVAPGTVSQHIGLNDKNGTEVYEGDIVRFTYSYEKQGYHTIVTNTYIGVIALNKYFQTCMMVGNEEYHIDNCIRNGEVVGNIHDNLELINE